LNTRDFRPAIQRFALSLWSPGELLQRLSSWANTHFACRIHCTRRPSSLPRPMESPLTSSSPLRWRKRSLPWVPLIIWPDVESTPI